MPYPLLQGGLISFDNLPGVVLRAERKHNLELTTCAVKISFIVPVQAEFHAVHQNLNLMCGLLDFDAVVVIRANNAIKEIKTLRYFYVSGFRVKAMLIICHIR